VPIPEGILADPSPFLGGASSVQLVRRTIELPDLLEAIRCSDLILFDKQVGCPLRLDIQVLSWLVKRDCPARRRDLKSSEKAQNRINIFTKESSLLCSFFLASEL
jgi:hypothetical protein